MMSDHTKGPDSESTDEFVTGNYAISTTSSIEWFFVVEPTEDSLRKLGCVKWPTEAEHKLPDTSRHRQPQTLATFEDNVKQYNKRLKESNQPPVIRQELIGARLYTGPMFVKYNGVLRGLHTTSHNCTTAPLVSYIIIPTVFMNTKNSPPLTPDFTFAI